MNRRLKQAAVGIVVLFAAAQLVRPARAKPPTDASRTIAAQPGTSSDLVTVLGRACGDCHSNATVWPSYTQIAPLSWIMAAAVKEGRKAVNFSEWGTYPADRQQRLLAASCAEVTAGKMPGSAWTWLHPEARLSTQDVATICVAAGGGAHQP